MAANRIPQDKIDMPAKCGKCQADLPEVATTAEPEASYKIRCTECSTKNRVPAGKLDADAKCGKCGSILKTEELFTMKENGPGGFQKHDLMMKMASYI